MDRLAAALRERGVAKGDRVMVHARNSNAMFESMWASFKIGAVWVPTNFRLTPAEVAGLAETSRARGDAARPRLPGPCRCGARRRALRAAP